MLHFLFDGPPGPEAGRFVEVNDDNGASVNVGTWTERHDGLWSLDADLVPLPTREKLEKVIKKWDGYRHLSAECAELADRLLALLKGGGQ